MTHPDKSTRSDDCQKYDCAKGIFQGKPGKSTTLYLESVSRHELLHNVQAGGHAFWGVGLHAPHPLELHNVPTLIPARDEKCLCIVPTYIERRHTKRKAQFSSSPITHVQAQKGMMVLRPCVIAGHDRL